VGPRRAGDTASLIADTSKVRRVLGWAPRRDLNEIVTSAAAFHRVHGVHI
jgi:UDP-glucose 4-epimerase